MRKVTGEVAATSGLKVLLTLLPLLLSGIACTSAKRKAEVLTALRAAYSPVRDMGTVVSAGVTLPQYSERLTDALLRFRNSSDVCEPTLARLKDKNLSQAQVAGQAWQHLGLAMDAYTLAKDYFGDKYDSLGCDDGCSDLPQAEYDQVKARFPNLPELHESYLSSELRRLHPEYAENTQPGYRRSDMLQALWKVADLEVQAAKAGMNQLDSM